MLESGFPRTLTYSCALAEAVNTFSCVVMILLGGKHSMLFEVFVDST